MLTLVMIVKNEERSIERCLKSVVDLVDDIVIVDTGSTDSTIEIAKKYNANIYDFKWIDDFSAARNFSLSKSKTDWNLVLDADEYIVDFDKKEIHKFMKNKKKFIGRIERINLLEEDGHVKEVIETIPRLLPKGVVYEGIIHEQPDESLKRAMVPITIEHDGYSYGSKFDRNISLLLKSYEGKVEDNYIEYQIAKTYFNNNEYEKADKYFEKFYKSIDRTISYWGPAVVLYIRNLMHLKKFEEGLDIISNEYDQLQNYSDFQYALGLFYMELIEVNPGLFNELIEMVEASYLNALASPKENIFESVEGTGSFYASYNLGILYELIGRTDLAIKYLEMSSADGYEKATKRLEKIK